MAKSVREQIIEVLSSGEFVSGQMLGDQLGISRAAISKHIKAISQMGLDVFRITGKGYKLSKPLSLLNQTTIESTLKRNAMLMPVEVFNIIDSTNSYLLNRTADGLQSGHTCVAEYQSQGRGRRGKQWVSPFGSHIYMSFYWPLEEGMSAAMGLSLVAGIAVSECLHELYGINAQVKWPNDIYIEGKKAAGILVELEGQNYDNSHAIIGLGLNVNMPQQSESAIDQPWTDLSKHTDINIDRNQLVAQLIGKLSEKLTIHKHAGLEPMLNQWHTKDYFLGKQVVISAGEQQRVGICRGINNQGALLLEADNRVEPIYGGEISLRLV